jgi:uncharacterized protein (DUF302 family)
MLVIKEYTMKALRIFLFVMIMSHYLLTGIWASDVRTSFQPVVVNSHNSFAETKDKLRGAIEARNLAIIFHVNRKDIMATVGIEGRNSATIGFVSLMMEHRVLRAEPRASLEMPLKIVARKLD